MSDVAKSLKGFNASHLHLPRRRSNPYTIPVSNFVGSCSKPRKSARSPGDILTLQYALSCSRFKVRDVMSHHESGGSQVERCSKRFVRELFTGLRELAWDMQVI